jgi:thioesterase DpgC
MLPTSTVQERRGRLTVAGLAAEAVDRWLAALGAVDLPEAPAPERLDRDAARLEPIFAQGWALCEALPPKSHRSAAERGAGETLVSAMAELCERACRVHRAAMYERLTEGYRRHLRVDDLVWKAAEQWPGLLPSRETVRREQEKMQKDKDGREVQQGMFLSQVMAEPRAGLHLLVSMLRPKPESLELLKTFRERGSIDLGYARVEARGRIGYVFTRNPKFLNAEDEESLGPQETAVDLVLLHPELQMGVLRGEVVDHPRYKGRRVFDSGLNLTKLYHGKIGFAPFFIARDMGLVNKFYRGISLDGWAGGDEAENTLEKPWVAAVESFAIGGGCQILLVMDYVIAEAGSYFNLPARKEGIIPGAANLRLPRFAGERMARQGIMFDRTFYVDSPEGRTLVNEVVPREHMDQAIERAVENALMSGMVSAGGNRKALRVQLEPLDMFRRYMATYCREQAFCHISDQLVSNLERNWNAASRKL